MKREHAVSYIERLEKPVYRRQVIEALAAAGRSPAYPVEFRSQFGEDALLWTLCGGKLDGFFIEVGAFDGYSYAATYALECAGWTGLLIEAIPGCAEQCRARRLHSRVVHAALGSRHGGETTFTVTDDGYGGMFSYVHPTPATKKHLSSDKHQRVTVPRTTMDALLEGHAGDIDAVVIDVEGTELDVLRGFDLERHRPKVMLVEDNSRGRDPVLSDYMASFSYTQVAWLKVNRVYVRTDLVGEWTARLESVGVRPDTARP